MRALVAAEEDARLLSFALLLKLCTAACKLAIKNSTVSRFV